MVMAFVGSYSRYGFTDMGSDSVPFILVNTRNAVLTSYRMDGRDGKHSHVYNMHASVHISGQLQMANDCWSCEG